MSGAQPSLQPDPPREPHYVRVLRLRLAQELEAHRVTKRENLTLRQQLAQMRHRLRRSAASKGRVSMEG